MSRSWRQQHNSCGPEIFFRNGDGWSSEVNKVQRGLKFSVVFLVKHNFLWLIPEAAPNILQRQPCLRENSYPSCHLCFPSLADEFRGAAQSGTPEADGEQWGQRATHNTSAFPTCKAGLCQLASPLLSAPVWEQRGVSTITPMPGWWSGGSPSVPGCRGAGELAGFQAVLLGECLHRSCWFIITCWRTGEYAQRG